VGGGPVGKLVDDSVGLLEGALVGDAVGLSLGDPVGKLVGDSDSVRLLEGALVCDAVGRTWRSSLDDSHSVGLLERALPST